MNITEIERTTVQNGVLQGCWPCHSGCVRPCSPYQESMALPRCLVRGPGMTARQRRFLQEQGIRVEDSPPELGEKDRLLAVSLEKIPRFSMIKFDISTYL